MAAMHRCAYLSLAIPCLLLIPTSSFAGTTERVSVSSAGVEGNGSSLYYPSVSDDGRYVAFCSGASNLVAEDMNESYDVFVHDRVTGTTDRVSISSAGVEANGHSRWPSISGDGRYVAFDSIAGDLIADDANGESDVFVHDRLTGATERVSVNSAGAEANGASRYPSISRDGRYVAFESEATNLGEGDTNGSTDIFVRDRLAGTTERVSINSDGVEGNGGSYYCAISGDGTHVAFNSGATNLVPGDANGARDTFVRDRLAGTTERVSVSSPGAEGNDRSEYPPSITGDGRYVAFCSLASNLVEGDTNGAYDVFVRDCLAGSTQRVSLSWEDTQGNAQSYYPWIASEGRYVVFSSSASDLVPGDTNGTDDIFVRDRVAGGTERVSISFAGGEANGDSQHPGISADGGIVAFCSSAGNLVPDDTNGNRDTFVLNWYHPTVAAQPPDPSTVVSGGSADLSASFSDTFGHGVASWSWDDGGAGGSFSPSADVESPTYTAPANTGDADILVTLTVTATCDGTPALSDTDSVTLTVQPEIAEPDFIDVPLGFWAYDEIHACVRAGIVSGYPDGFYHPEWGISRDQIAAFISRGLAGGDDAVPDGPEEPTFGDVPAGYWAYKYVEYAVAASIISGYGDGNYHPDWAVTRAQMAVFIARGIVYPTGEEGLATYVAPEEATFSDIPTDYWCYQHVEYLAAHGVVGGYPDGTYKPTWQVTRGQMAVYIARAFELPM